MRFQYFHQLKTITVKSRYRNKQKYYYYKNFKLQMLHHFTSF